MKNRKQCPVYLRRPNENDFPEIAERYLRSRKMLSQYAPNRFDRERFDKILEHEKSESNAFFLLCMNDDGRIAGHIQLSQIFHGLFQNAYLGYLLFEGFTGKGNMTYGVDLTLSFAFKQLKLHRVEANVQPDNLASIKVLQRCGFSKEGFSPKYLKIGGRWRDHERWAIIKENWSSVK